MTRRERMRLAAARLRSGLDQKTGREKRTIKRYTIRLENKLRNAERPQGPRKQSL